MEKCVKLTCSNPSCSRQFLKIKALYDFLTRQGSSNFFCSRECNAQHKNFTMHGKKGTATNISWQSVIQNCTNPNRASYDAIGGRGISFDPRWVKFDAFLEDMGERPEGKKLKRIDLNGDYTKDNCVWATDIEIKSRKRNRNKYSDISPTYQVT